MAIPLIVFALALAACVGLARVFSRSGRKPYSSVLFWAVLGYIVAGAIVWSIVPAAWTLSFPQTLAASVDSETYGHPVEHYAENVLVVMLAACVSGSILFGAMATYGGRLRRT